MRLLVVEDDPKVARFIQKGIAEEFFTVDLASDGEAALDRAGVTTYDLIILDVMLPGMDGFGVCRRLRAMGLDVPILMLSARGMVEDRVKGLDTGADDSLTKPFAFAELRARVRAAAPPDAERVSPAPDRRPASRPGRAGGDAPRSADRFDTEGIRPARVSDAQRRPGADPGHDRRTCLGFHVGSAHERD